MRDASFPKTLASGAYHASHSGMRAALPGEALVFGISLCKNMFKQFGILVSVLISLSRIFFLQKRTLFLTVAVLFLTIQQGTYFTVYASDKEGIFRSSDKRVFSSGLGAETVTSVVLINKVRHPGLFISAVSPNGLVQQLRLPAGAVLLTLDGYSISSAQIADKWIRQRPQKTLQYTYALSKNGKTRIYSGQSDSFASVNPKGSPEASAQASTDANPKLQFSIDELENYCISLINESRSKNRQPAVRQDSSLSRLARRYADYMLSHPERYVRPQGMSPHMDLEGRSPMQRAREAGISTEVHENLGRESRGFGNDKYLVARQHNIMMSEPEGQHNHRFIILDPDARSVGVGIARDAANLYLVEEFGH